MTVAIARPGGDVRPDTGLSDEKVEAIVRTIAGSDTGTPRVDQVILFGSRAKGTWREGSDIDLAVTGDGLARRDIWRWKDALEEALFPWTPDVILVGETTNSDLLDHIRRVGIVLYDHGAR